MSIVVNSCNHLTSSKKNALPAIWTINLLHQAWLSILGIKNFDSPFKTFQTFPNWMCRHDHNAMHILPLDFPRMVSPKKFHSQTHQSVTQNWNSNWLDKENWRAVQKVRFWDWIPAGTRRIWKTAHLDRPQSQFYLVPQELKPTQPSQAWSLKLFDGTWTVYVEC